MLAAAGIAACKDSGPAQLHSLDAGGIHTAIARDPLPMGDSPGLMLLDSFVP